ncbi:MAG: V-type ATP synthase subunit D [Bacteroides sp.]
MAIKFQYNKTSLQQLEKQLKIRVRTLPIIKNKESALRMDVKKCKEEAVELEEKLEKQIQAYEAMFALWNEFDASLIKVSDVHLGIKKIAGVRVPLLENVDFEIRPFSLFNSPKWYPDGIHLLKKLAQTAIEREFILAKLNLLEHARKKTTQKVNLFEKVQIPGYQDALRKIKRFMEDEENLSKSSQKILKSLQEKRKEVEA